MGIQRPTSVTSYVAPVLTGALGMAAGMSPQNAAITVIAMYALENTQRAAAGPITYWTCMLACEMIAPLFIPICVGGCLPLLAAPSP